MEGFDSESFARLSSGHEPLFATDQNDLQCLILERLDRRVVTSIPCHIIPDPQILPGQLGPAYAFQIPRRCFCGLGYC